MSQESVIDAQEASEMHEAMDYAQHQATWGNFVTMVKWGIYELTMLVLALYCFIQAGQPVLGFVLLLAGLLSMPAYALFRPKR